jgi:hypothetical protein
VDFTPTAEIVIVEEAALREHLDEVRATLGAGDTLHLVSASGERLGVESISLADALPNRPPEQHPPEQRPIWLRD